MNIEVAVNSFLAGGCMAAITWGFGLSPHWCAVLGGGLALACLWVGNGMER